MSTPTATQQFIMDKGREVGNIGVLSTPKAKIEARIVVVKPTHRTVTFKAKVK